MHLSEQRLKHVMWNTIQITSEIQLKMNQSIPFPHCFLKLLVERKVIFFFSFQSTFLFCHWDKTSRHDDISSCPQLVLYIHFQLKQIPFIIYRKHFKEFPISCIENNPVIELFKSKKLYDDVRVNIPDQESHLHSIQLAHIMATVLPDQKYFSIS